MKELIRIKKQLEGLTKSGTPEARQFAQDILDLIEEMQKDSALAYNEGKADGMETMARILCGSDE